MWVFFGGVTDREEQRHCCEDFVQRAGWWLNSLVTDLVKESSAERIGQFKLMNETIHLKFITTPKNNIEPENDGLVQMTFLLQGGRYSQVPAVKLPGCRNLHFRFLSSPKHPPTAGSWSSHPGNPPDFLEKNSRVQAIDFFEGPWFMQGLGEANPGTDDFPREPAVW